MSDTASHDKTLNDMILSGKALEAFETYYADDVVMEEPTGRREGKDANRAYEEQFFASIQELHGANLVSAAVTGDTSFSEWVWDVTFKDGNRVQMEQVARRQWKDGKIVRERFYYNT